MAAGPANNGTASGLTDNSINSSLGTLSVATLLFLACRLPLTISRAMMNKIAPPAMLNVSADIFKCVSIKEPNKPKNISTQKAMAEPLRAIHCFCLWWRLSVIARKIGIEPIGSITAK